MRTAWERRLDRAESHYDFMKEWDGGFSGMRFCLWSLDPRKSGPVHRSDSLEKEIGQMFNELGRCWYLPIKREAQP